MPKGVGAGGGIIVQVSKYSKKFYNFQIKSGNFTKNVVYLTYLKTDGE